MIANAKKRILIVEDESIIAIAIKECLEDFGYEVVGIADTGMKAILDFFGTEPDLVLMDIRLKGQMDGISAAEKIRMQSAVPIVFLTGNQDPATFERAKIDGAYGYVLKPYQPRELQIVVEIALNQFKEKQDKAALDIALLNSEKLGTVGTLTAGIIHDIRGSVTVLGAMALKLSKLARSAEATPSELSEISEKIIKRVDDINNTVVNYQSLIDASDYEKAEPLSLVEICRQALELCQYVASIRGVKFKELPEGASPKVFCGRISLLQVLVNLIRNSIDAVGETPDAWIAIFWTHVEDHGMVLSVSDSGLGIPAEIRSKLFKPLFTTKPVGQGTGLGLSLCRRLLDKYGATLVLDETKTNTTFSIRLATVVEKAVASSQKTQ